MAVRRLHAGILVRCSRYEEALKVCNMEGGIGGEDMGGGDMDLTRARALRGLGRMDEALVKYRAVVMRDPDNSTVKDEFKLVREMGDKLREAQSMMQGRGWAAAEESFTEGLALGKGDALSDAYHSLMLCGRGEAREKRGRADEVRYSMIATPSIPQHPEP